MTHHPKNETENKSKLWKGVLLGLLAVVVLIVLFFLFYKGKSVLGAPTLTIEVPPKASVSSKETVALDLSISNLGDARYPAASFSIAFDPAHLEFVGVEEGNVFVYDQVNLTEERKKLPEWSYSAEKANETGLINLMYLDLTGGRCAFSQDLLSESDNVVLRLEFRLRGSARAGDVYPLTVEDAVFAASDSNESLATNQRTLRIRNGKIVVGE